jgi:uncharacterized protein YbjQ (UPF0145 family)
MPDPVRGLVEDPSSRVATSHGMTDSAQIHLLTTEARPGQEQLGFVRYWGHDKDLLRAEQVALAGIREHAAALGATAIAGLRIEVEQELRIASDGPVLPKIAFLKSEGTWLVYAYGTAVRDAGA